MRSIQCSGAQAWVECQEQFLNDKLSHLFRRVREGMRLRLRFHKLKADGALHTFCLDFRTFALSCMQSKKAWELLRARIWIGWVIDGHREEFEIVFPPVIIIGVVNASALHDGLWGQRYHRALTRFLDGTSEVAPISLAPREADCGTNLTKALYFEAQELYPWPQSKTIFCHWPCAKHGNNHTVKHISDTVDDNQERLGEDSTPRCKHGSLILAIAAFIRWAKMGNYFLRLLLAVERVLRAMHMNSREPPSGALSSNARNSLKSFLFLSSMYPVGFQALVV